MQDAKMQEFVRLAPRMAHHIRDKLSVVETAADLLIYDKSIPTEARDKIALIKGQLGHVAGLARQFLIITGNQASQMAVLDIRDVLSELAPLLQILLGKGNHLQIELDPDLWPIKADYEQFEAIFSNLSVNANDAMPSGGSLRMDEWTKDGLALFAHCGNDNGFDLFDAHSQKSPKYDAAYTRQRWEEIKGSPPNRTGVGKLYKRACANGWVPKLARQRRRMPSMELTARPMRPATGLARSFTTFPKTQRAAQPATCGSTMLPSSASC